MLDGGALIPVFVRLAHMRICLHLRQYLIGDRSYHLWVRPHNAERNRPGRIRPKDKPVGAKARFGGDSRRHLLAKTKDELVSLLRIRSQDDHLGEVWNRQIRIVGEPEARRAAADIGADNLRFRLSTQPLFDLHHRGLGRLDTGTLRQRDVDQHLRSVGVRKELLLDEAHSEGRREEDDDDGAGNEELVFDGPDD